MKQLFFNLLGLALITLFVSAQIPESTRGFLNSTDNNYISSAFKNVHVEKIDERQMELFPEEEKSKTGISFHQGNWDEVLETAKKENKPIFLDISASWCAPCKLLKANTFTDPEVGEFYNTNFINVAFDGEKGEGVLLADKFKISAYPTLLFVNPDGQIIAKVEGYKSPEQFIKLGKQIKNK